VPIRLFQVPQLVASNDIGQQPSLPSFLYFPTDNERDGGSMRLPWNAHPDLVAGVFAREHGALVPGRQVASAKSWLSNALVDRTAALLPWAVTEGPKLSPVDASARLLAHLRDAWNHQQARDTTVRLEALPVVLTVPASFDEEARELTVAAARAAGFEQLTLLEEPLAALYAWIAAHRRTLTERFADGALVLVCDVGGGTTDFSLIRASIEADGGELSFERIAIGEHLLLGGDNLDLALAAAVEQKFGTALTLTQHQTLRRKCSAAKEQLLSNASTVDRVPITVLGAGRGVVGQGLTAELTRDEILRVLADGFLPLTAADDVPARDRRVGLRELGLPYEIEPAITRHLAAFLTRAARTAGTEGLARPDAVLFNGGFFTPALVRDRVLDALEGWLGARPEALENETPESAVAIGAAFYGRLRQDPAASRRLLIRAGTARAYYIGVGGGSDNRDSSTVVCVMPRGTQEGTRLELNRGFTVITNQPAAFTLYSATDTAHAAGDIVTLDAGADVQRHAPLATALRYGKRSQRVPLTVTLAAAFTETGTLELWCQSRSSEHRWRLGFNLRAIEADTLEEAVSSGDASEAHPAIIISEDSVVAAESRIRDVFGEGAGGENPQALPAALENVLGHGKAAWPLDTIRRLADVLLHVAAGRRGSATQEVRWMNLAGFCVRPGFGSALDAWRVSELRKVYLEGLLFPKEVQNQVEWLVLWQRTSAGFSTGQQRELAQRVSGQLGIGGRKPPRLNAQIERESWRLLGGLERLDGTHKTSLGDELLERLRRDPRNTAWVWTLGRLGARTPLYGPLNTVIPAAVAERWIDRLLGVKLITPEVAAAIIQIGARTGDPARDVARSVADAAVQRLEEAAVDAAAVEALRVPKTPDGAGAARVFGESLPEGLRLRAEDCAD